VPFIAGSAVASLFLSPAPVWPLFMTLAALGVMVAVIALLRVQRKQAHVWGDYYADVS
jgi:hypothetical protein